MPGSKLTLEISLQLSGKKVVALKKSLATGGRLSRRLLWQNPLCLQGGCVVFHGAVSAEVPDSFPTYISTVIRLSVAPNSFSAACMLCTIGSGPQR